MQAPGKYRHLAKSCSLFLKPGYEYLIALHQTGLIAHHKQKEWSNESYDSSAVHDRHPVIENVVGVKISLRPKESFLL